MMQVYPEEVFNGVQPWTVEKKDSSSFPLRIREQTGLLAQLKIGKCFLYFMCSCATDLTPILIFLKKRIIFEHQLLTIALLQSCL